MVQLRNKQTQKKKNKKKKLRKMLTILLVHYLLYWGISFGLIVKYKPLLLDGPVLSKFMFCVISFNQLVVTPTLYILMRPIIEEAPVVDLPFPFNVMCYLPVHSVYFYVVHSLLHTSFMFENVHFLHHKFRDTLPFHALWCTPVEHAVLNSASFFVGPVFFGTKGPALLLWTIIATISTCFAHGGALRKKKLRHDIHHTNGKYNLSSGMFFMDQILGSSKAPEEKKQKHEVFAKTQFGMYEITARKRDMD
jgi:sterol desaturase/sphingolipid hydroxylase (fatty acid hydroxylase superfamily)